MVDTASKAVRSRMMSNIRGKDTKPEIVIRKALHHKGFRYKLHDKSLPGKPDIALPKYRAIIQVNGCFWHMHNCDLFRWPSTRADFWREKLTSNAERDLLNLEKLHREGWKSLVVWECAMRGRGKLSQHELFKSISTWIVNDPMNAEIPCQTI